MSNNKRFCGSFLYLLLKPISFKSDNLALLLSCSLSNPTQILMDDHNNNDKIYNTLRSCPIPSLSIPRKENSNMVQISTFSNSIWRGNLWSSIHFKIKLDKYFLCNNNDVCSPFVLAASIQGGISGKLYDKNKYNFKFHFEHNTTDDESQAAITINPYNNLEVCIHQEVFKDSECFYLLLEALHQDGSYLNRPIIFGRSQLIS